MQGLTGTPVDPNAAPGALEAAAPAASDATQAGPPQQPPSAGYDPTQATTGTAQAGSRATVGRGTVQAQDIASGLVAKATNAGLGGAQNITSLKQGANLIVAETVSLEEQGMDLASFNQLCDFSLGSVMLA